MAISPGIEMKSNTGNIALLEQVYGIVEKLYGVIFLREALSSTRV
jgi:hypothetical protein